MENPLYPPQKGSRAPSQIFGPFLLWPNGCMRQDATWYGARPQPTGRCVTWGPSPQNFRPMFIIVIVISLEHCTMHSHASSSSSFSILCILFLEKFNRTQYVPLCTVAPHSAYSWSRSCESVKFQIVNFVMRRKDVKCANGWLWCVKY